ncbi:MAG: heat repeat-containing PBS lyase [Candidatus Scalindua rubra]|uniref:Heat repeat-containing PBS lyase n=1 Tax=Candidatus Scalindua rubra TaxID=1872076 RepID=A0A1E3XGF2_9BACT|nr:MAG: heat repeat-containing PBS lyase [Candidatus Scalindua rubra]
MKDDRVEELINALGDRDLEVREEAAEALGKIGDARAVEPLIKALGDWVVGGKAAKALGEIGDARAVKPLIKELGDMSSNIQSEAAWALGKIDDTRAVEPLIRALGGKDEYVRKEATKALLKIGTSAIGALKKALADRNRDIRMHAAEILVRIGDPAVEPLIMALGDENLVVREKAAETLGKICDTRAVEPLIRALEDRVSDVRKESAKALGKIGDTCAIEPLIKAVGDDEWNVREKAREALVKIGKPAIESLIMHLRNSNLRIRENVINVLDQLCYQPRNNTEMVHYLIANRHWEKVEGICSLVTRIVFGEISTDDDETSLKNPDVSELTIPMKNISKVIVDAETYDFHQVERFITYAVNYIGEKRLRKKVEVVIHGNPEKLHPNLRNLFKNLFREVKEVVFRQ